MIYVKDLSYAHIPIGPDSKAPRNIGSNWSSIPKVFTACALHRLQVSFSENREHIEGGLSKYFRPPKPVSKTKCRNLEKSCWESNSYNPYKVDLYLYIDSWGPQTTITL
jgi:hypothetical protein